ncbi:MAG: cytochrome c [Anaerolineae bacterium]|nr:cytochrome c [Anaerolineae bacterium]
MTRKKKNSLPVLLALTGLLFIGGGAAIFLYQPTPAQAITVNAQPISAEQLALGEQMYNANCAVCHGVDGAGQPNWKIPNENGIYPAPPHDGEGHTWHHADDLLLEIIAEGGGAFSPTSGMPGYKDLLTEAEMVAVLAYIKTFWGPEEVEFQSQVMQNSQN